MATQAINNVINVGIIAGIGLGGYLGYEAYQELKNAGKNIIDGVTDWSDHPFKDLPWAWKDPGEVGGNTEITIPKNAADATGLQKYYNDWVGRWANTYDAFQGANVGTQDAFLNASWQQQQIAENKWYDEHPEFDRTKDIHAYVGWGTQASEDAARQFVTRGYYAPDITFEQYIQNKGSSTEDWWVSTRGTYKQEQEDIYYRNNPWIDRSKDPHYATGYYGSAADQAVKDYFGKKVVVLPN